MVVRDIPIAVDLFRAAARGAVAVIGCDCCSCVLKRSDCKSPQPAFKSIVKIREDMLELACTLQLYVMFSIFLCSCEGKTQRNFQLHNNYRSPSSSYHANHFFLSVTAHAPPVHQLLSNLGIIRVRFCRSILLSTSSKRNPAWY